jgi:hypothetical protein
MTHPITRLLVQMPDVVDPRNPFYDIAERRMREHNAKVEAAMVRGIERGRKTVRFPTISGGRIQYVEYDLRTLDADATGTPARCIVS